MTQHHKWDIEAWESLYPFERDLYIDMLAETMAGDHTKPALPEDDLKKLMKERRESANTNKPSTEHQGSRKRR